MNVSRVHYAVFDTTRPCRRNKLGVVLLGVSVVDSGGETPGPISNPVAKPARADGTAPGRVWESKLPPTIKQNTTTYGKEPVKRQPLFTGLFDVLQSSSKPSVLLKDGYRVMNVIPVITVSKSRRRWTLLYLDR